MGEVGRGGMAVVYRATDLRLNRTVAIKVLPPDVAFNADVKRRFIREAQTAAQLNHPNIVPIYSVDEKDGASVVYFVMSFIEGESLGLRLTREGHPNLFIYKHQIRSISESGRRRNARSGSLSTEEA